MPRPIIYQAADESTGKPCESGGKAIMVDCRTPFASVWKLQSGGKLIWFFVTNYAALCVALDSNSNVLVGTAGGGAGDNIYSIDSDSNKNWSDFVLNSYSAIYDIIADSEDSVIATGGSRAGACLFKWNSSGTHQWDSGVQIGAEYGNCLLVDGTDIFQGGYLGMNGEHVVAMFDEDGVEGWKYKWDGFFYAAMDMVFYSGTSYIYAVTNDGVCKLDASDGSEEAQDNDPEYANAVAVDDSDIFVAGVKEGSVGDNVYKYNTSLVKQWGAEHGHHLWPGMTDIAIDSSGNVWVTGKRDAVNSKSVWKLDASDGSELASYDTGGDTHCLIIDGSNNVIVGGARAGNKTIWKLNNSCVLQWSKDTGNDIREIIFDGSDIVAVGDLGTWGG